MIKIHLSFWHLYFTKYFYTAFTSKIFIVWNSIQLNFTFVVFIRKTLDAKVLFHIYDKNKKLQTSRNTRKKAAQIFCYLFFDFLRVFTWRLRRLRLSNRFKATVLPSCGLCIWLSATLIPVLPWHRKWHQSKLTSGKRYYVQHTYHKNPIFLCKLHISYLTHWCLFRSRSTS